MAWPFDIFPVTVQVLLAVALMLVLAILAPIVVRLLKHSPALALILVAVPALALIWPKDREPPPPIPPVVPRIEAPPEIAPVPDTPQVLVVRTKQNVYPDKLDTNLLRMVPKIYFCYQQVMGENYEPVVTSANDGEEHRLQSAHYRNQALDFRANNLDRVRALALHEKLQAALGKRFLVLLESVGSSNQHIHVELKIEN